MMTGDEDRIMQKAYELWESEGRPHGRDLDHWDQAKEIIALHDSAGSALLPRDTGADTPVEEKSIAIDNEGQAPNLTDTGEHDLTAIDREPAITAPPAPAVPAAATPAPAAPAAKAAPAKPETKKAAAKRASAPAGLSTSAEVPAKKPRGKGR